jgi:N6-L-threonylcarbamoyladenine synthase
MIILSVETSCDETAVSIVEAKGPFPHAQYRIRGNALFSQIEIHRAYGGVFPALAKREHAKALTPLLTTALAEAQIETAPSSFPADMEEVLGEFLHREPGLSEALGAFLEAHERPAIDLIAVTSGPGLEPALWVGINFARALSYAWGVPVVPVNHMEGHILSSIFNGEILPDVHFPAVSLLISGGHTELVSMAHWGQYTKIGETRDDAVGEAFDKVARMLGLPYPGGPEISKRADEARKRDLPRFTPLPRPMLDSKDLDFSFSGLKTAVRYGIEGLTLTPDNICSVAREFEDAVTEVLTEKTRRAIETAGAHTLIVGGGVSANTHIRESFLSFFTREYPTLTIYFPPRHLSTDNSIMIALAGHAHIESGEGNTTISADGNLSL